MGSPFDVVEFISGNFLLRDVLSDIKNTGSYARFFADPRIVAALDSRRSEEAVSTPPNPMTALPFLRAFGGAGMAVGDADDDSLRYFLRMLPEGLADDLEEKLLLRDPDLSTKVHNFVNSLLAEAIGLDPR